MCPMREARIFQMGQVLKEAFVRQEPSLFLWCPVLFAIGIGLYFSLSVEPPLWAGPAVFLIFLVVLTAAKQSRIGLILISGLCLAAAGFSAAQIRAALVHTPMLGKTLGPVWIEGIILELEKLGPKEGSRIVLEPSLIERLDERDIPRRVRLRVRKDEGLVPGLNIRVLGELNPPSPPVSPGAFDFQRYAYFKRIGAVGFVYKRSEILDTDRNSAKISGWAERLRQDILLMVERHVPYPYAAFITTFLTGERGTISEADKEAMRASGLAHLLAISGLHVGMMAGSVFFMVRLILACFPAMALRYPIKKIAACFALVTAVFYTVIVGAGIPAQRALLMTGLVFLAIFLDRSPLSLRFVAFAALVILAVSPESLVSVSFQMSFAAVTALITFYEWVRPVWSRMHRRAGVLRRVALYLIGVAITSVVAGLATGIFALYHFQSFALYGVLANVMAMPVMAFVVMPFAVLSYLCMALGIEVLAFAVMEWGVSWILAIAHWTAGLEDAVWQVPAWPFLSFLLIVSGGLFLMLWNGRERGLGVVVAAAGLLLLPLADQPDILMAEKAELIAIRGQKSGDLYLSTRRKKRYTAEQWMRRNGQRGEKAVLWPRETEDEDFPLICGSKGCRGVINGHRIAVVQTPDAFQEDCGWADVILPDFPGYSRRACDAPYLVGWHGTRRDGAHAVYVSKQGIRIVKTRPLRGKRPWVTYGY